jgi:hypothetical protein
MPQINLERYGVLCRKMNANHKSMTEPMTKPMKNQRSSKCLFTVTTLLATGLAFASTARQRLLT